MLGDRERAPEAHVEEGVRGVEIELGKTRAARAAPIARRGHDVIELRAVEEGGELGFLGDVDLRAARAAAEFVRRFFDTRCVCRRDRHVCAIGDASLRNRVADARAAAEHHDLLALEAHMLSPVVRAQSSAPRGRRRLLAG